MGKKPTVQSRMAAVEARLGATTGASKGSKPPPKPQVKPIIGKGKIGATVKWKF